MVFHFHDQFKECVVLVHTAKLSFVCRLGDKSSQHSDSRAARNSMFFRNGCATSIAFRCLWIEVPKAKPESQDIPVRVSTAIFSHHETRLETSLHPLVAVLHPLPSHTMKGTRCYRGHHSFDDIAGLTVHRFVAAPVAVAPAVAWTSRWCQDSDLLDVKIGRMACVARRAGEGLVLPK